MHCLCRDIPIFPCKKSVNIRKSYVKNIIYISLRRAFLTSEAPKSVYLHNKDSVIRHLDLISMLSKLIRTKDIIDKLARLCRNVCLHRN